MDSRIFRRFVYDITEETTSSKYQTARFGLLASIILITILSIVLILFEAVNDYNITMQVSQQKLIGYTRAIKEYSEKTHKVADLVMEQTIGEIIRQGGIDRIEERQLMAFSTAICSNSPGIFDVFVADRTGKLLVETSQFPVESEDVSNYDYLMHHRDDPSNRVYIGRPVQNISSVGQFQRMRLLEFWLRTISISSSLC